MVTATFNEKEVLVTNKFGLEFKEETSDVLHCEHSVVWC